MAPPLAQRGWTLYSPDLPGFGASSRRVPDYSITAHARYVVEWLDQLGIERAHVLGFSMGGGVALELYRLAPERVASVVLLSSIGVQEMELLGYYSLNHALHGAPARRALVPASSGPALRCADATFRSTSPTRATSTTPISVHCAARSPRSSLRS